MALQHLIINDGPLNFNKISSLRRYILNSSSNNSKLLNKRINLSPRPICSQDSLIDSERIIKLSGTSTTLTNVNMKPSNE